MNEFEKQERRNLVDKAKKNFNYLVKKYMEVHLHHKSWIEGIFYTLETVVEEVKLGE